jgi:hypothetical protein
LTDENLMTVIQMDIREIMTLLVERKEAMERQSRDIDEAFHSIRSLNDAVLTMRMTTEKLEEMFQASKEYDVRTDNRLRKLEKDSHRMSWILTIATGIVCAAAVKFFVG